MLLMSSFADRTRELPIELFLAVVERAGGGALLHEFDQ